VRLVSDARYVLPGDPLPDLRAQPALLWAALGREESSVFVDWPEAYMPRETWNGTLDDVATRVAFRHAQTPGKSLDHREPVLEIEQPLATRGFRFSLYRSPDESLSPLDVAPELVARVARRAEAVPVAVARTMLAEGLEARLVAVAKHIDEITIDDDKVLVTLRLWPTDGDTLRELLDLAQTLRRRADRAITDAIESTGKSGTDDDGSLRTHPDVVALRQRLADRERATRQRTALVAALLFGIPLALLIAFYLLR
jgi:hypothetical protein